MKKRIFCNVMIGLLILITGCSSQTNHESVRAINATEKISAQQMKNTNNTGVIHADTVATTVTLQEKSNNFIAVSTKTKTRCTMLAEMSVARVYPGIEAVKGKLYAIGGDEVTTSNLTVEAYNPKAQKWKAKTGLKQCRNAFVTAVVNNKIYVIGGYGDNIKSSISLNQEYDPATDTWKNKTDMPTARQLSGVAVVDKKIYVIGGVNPSDTKGAYAFEVYDPELDQWKSLAKLEEMITNPAVAVVKGKIYLFGGTLGSGNCVNTVRVYDPSKDKWEKLKPMSVEKTDMKAETIGNKIYLFGGLQQLGYQNYSFLNTVEEYDPESGKWRALPSLTSGKAMFDSAIIKKNVYLVGGLSSSFQPTNTGVIYNLD